MSSDGHNAPSDNEWPGRSFLCSCFTDALHVMGGDEDGDVSFAVWQYGGWPTSWRQRLRYIWRIVRKGDPYGDQIVLSKETTQELARHLNHLTGGSFSVYFDHSSSGPYRWTGSVSTDGGHQDGSRP